MNRENHMGAEEIKKQEVERKATEAIEGALKAGTLDEFLNEVNKGTDLTLESDFIEEAEALTVNKVTENEIKKREEELRKRAS